MSEPRWLNPEDAAAYIGERVDRLPRLRKAGKLPEPSTHLGPRKPRYDRVALDALFLGKAEANDRADEIAIVNSIVNLCPRRKKATSRRNHQGIQIQQEAATQD